MKDMLSDLLNTCVSALIAVGGFGVLVGLYYGRFPNEPRDRKLALPVIAISGAIFVTFLLVRARIISFAVSEAVLLLPLTLAGCAYVAVTAYRKRNWLNVALAAAWGSTMIGLTACAWRMTETKLVFLTLGDIGNSIVLAFAVFAAVRWAFEKRRAKSHGAAVDAQPPSATGGFHGALTYPLQESHSLDVK